MATNEKPANGAATAQNGAAAARRRRRRRPNGPQGAQNAQGQAAPKKQNETAKQNPTGKQNPPQKQSQPRAAQQPGGNARRTKGAQPNGGKNTGKPAANKQSVAPKAPAVQEPRKNRAAAPQANVRPNSEPRRRNAQPKQEDPGLELISRRPPKQKFANFEEYIAAHGGVTAPLPESEEPVSPVEPEAPAAEAEA